MKTNYVAAVISAIVYFVLQAVWFTVFAERWIVGLGWTPERVADAKAHITPWPYVVAFICNLVMAGVLGNVMAWTGRTRAASGAAMGALLWLGLVLTSLATEFGFERKPASFTAIAAGAALLGLVAMGAIQGWWMGRAAKRSRAASA